MVKTGDAGTKKFYQDFLDDKEKLDYCQGMFIDSKRNYMKTVVFCDDKFSYVIPPLQSQNTYTNIVNLNISTTNDVAICRNWSMSYYSFACQRHVLRFFACRVLAPKQS